MIQLTYYRVIACCLIVLCHYLRQMPKISFLSQFLNIGVYMFFILSSYLYSTKNIESFKKFIIKRIRKIILPYYVFLIFYILLCSLYGLYSFNNLIRNMFPYFLNIQAFTLRIEGTGHLWFITIIFLCYLITPLLYKSSSYIYKKNIMILCGSIVIQILISYVNKNLGEWIFYILLYINSYYYFKNNLLKTPRNSLILIIICITIRILGRYLFNDTIFYSNVIVLYTQTIIALLAFKIICNFRLKRNRILEYINNICYEIYLSHYIFIIGSFSIIYLTSNIIVNIFIGLIITLISAKCINITSKLLNDTLEELIV